jgi:hypothetical protein
VRALGWALLLVGVLRHVMESHFRFHQLHRLHSLGCFDVSTWQTTFLVSKDDLSVALDQVLEYLGPATSVPTEAA